MPEADYFVPRALMKLFPSLSVSWENGLLIIYIVRFAFKVMNSNETKRVRNINMIKDSLGNLIKHGEKSIVSIFQFCAWKWPQGRACVLVWARPLRVQCVQISVAEFMTPINTPEDVLCTAEQQNETKIIVWLTLSLTMNRVYYI